MGAIFQSLGRTVVAGIVVLVVILLIVGQATGTWVAAGTRALLRGLGIWL